MIQSLRRPSPPPSSSSVSSPELALPRTVPSSWRLARMVLCIVLPCVLWNLFQESSRSLRFQLQIQSTVMPLMIVAKDPTNINTNQTRTYNVSNVTSININVSIPDLPNTPDPMMIGPIQSSDRRPRHLRLLLVGDSLTRYQYLSLVYYLRHGIWEPTAITVDHPRRMVCEKEYGNWTVFFTETNRNMAPYEWCDCYRMESKRASVHEILEARYYHDPRYDNYVYFLPKFGPGTIKGRWKPETIVLAVDEEGDDNDNDNTTTKSGGFVRERPARFPPPTWEYTWKNLGQFVSRLKTAKRRNIHGAEPPTHILLNGGLWPTDLEIRNHTDQDALIAGLRAANITIIYKTTTAKRHGRRLLNETDAGLPTKGSGGGGAKTTTKRAPKRAPAKKTIAKKAIARISTQVKIQNIPALQNTSMTGTPTDTTAAASSSSTTVRNRRRLGNVNVLPPLPPLEPYEERLCSLSDHCFDMSWTSRLTPRYYWDSVHFYEPVYRWINQDLLRLLTGDSYNDVTGSPPYHSWTALHESQP